MLKMFLWDIQTYKIRPELDLGEGGAMGSYCLMGMKFQLGKMQKFWRWVVAMATQHCECPSCHLGLRLNMA